MDEQIIKLAREIDELTAQYWTLQQEQLSLIKGSKDPKYERLKREISKTHRKRKVRLKKFGIENDELNFENIVKIILAVINMK